MVLAAEDEFSVVDTIISMMLLTFLISFIGISFYIAKTNHEEDDQEEFKKKFGSFYNRINYKKGPLSKYYFTATFVRKLLFVFIPIIFYSDNIFPLQFGLLLSVLYAILIVKLDAVESKTEWKLELFSEFMILVQFYHLMLFTDFVEMKDSQYEAGYSYILMIAFHVACLMAYIIISIVKNLIYQRKKRTYKRNLLE